MEIQTPVFHIATDEDVDRYKDNGEYRCASLDSEGFIHCCHRNQLAGVVSRYYHGVDDIQLLILDAEKLDSPLILENTVGGSELFPHVYGPINTEAITGIEAFGPSSTERQALGV